MALGPVRERTDPAAEAGARGSRLSVIPVCLAAWAGCVLLNVAFGSKAIPMTEVIQALVAFDERNYDHFIVSSQRLPRALIASFVGACLAVCGALLQGLTRNPLASPGLLGVSSGAVLFVVFFGFYWGVPNAWHGAVAFAGGWFGFFSCVLLARVARIAHDPRNLALILAGAIVSMAYAGIASALVLANESLRAELLSWMSGNVNHYYIDRLTDVWFVGAGMLFVLLCLAPALTLITLGSDKAAAAGVAVKPVTLCALTAAVAGAAAAVSVCGPIGFVGLVVPHLVRPVAGAHFSALFPACALVGAIVVLLADVVARVVFAPYVLHTSVLMSLLGGLAFIVIVKRHYLTVGVAARP
ncbi:MAG: iron ABC transporter permease [Pseudomonadota bacterium]